MPVDGRPAQRGSTAPTGSVLLHPRLQNALFTLLFLGALALLLWLGQTYSLRLDWTFGARNTLSPASRALLERLDGPVHVTAFARGNGLLWRHIENLVERYQREKPDLTLELVNPDLHPEVARDLGISGNGELLVSFDDRRGRVNELSEQGISNALLRLRRRSTMRIVFSAGHGERSPVSRAEQDLGAFAERLAEVGLEAEQLPLGIRGDGLDGETLLILASPRADLLPGVSERIQRHIDSGGNFLWLADPGGPTNLESLAESLGVNFLPGVIVDATTRVLGIDDPSFAMVAEYENHPTTAAVREAEKITLYPRAVGLDVEAVEGWRVTPILSTLSRSWSETSPLDGAARYDSATQDRPGPLLLGVALSRVRPKTGHEQRVVVVGDSDFLTNRFVSYGGNLSLGLGLVHWLGGDDQLVAIDPRFAPDATLDLSNATLLTIAAVFLLVLPGSLATGGLWVWWRRRRL